MELKDLFSELEMNLKTVTAHSTVIVLAKPTELLYYLESFTQVICSKFPCRFIVLKEETNTYNEFLKGKLNYIEISKGAQTVCEFIEIEYSSNQKERLISSLPKLLLPLLDVLLVLWQKEEEHELLLKTLQPYLTRVICDTEYANSFQTIYPLMARLEKDYLVGDLNYSRAGQFREILFKELSTTLYKNFFTSMHTIEVYYNPHRTLGVTSPLVQSYFLIEWLALWGNMEPNFYTQTDSKAKIYYDKFIATIQAGTSYSDISEGKITCIRLTGNEGTFHLERDPKNSSKLSSTIKTENTCSMPALFHSHDCQIGGTLIEQLQSDATNSIQMEVLKRAATTPFKRLHIGETEREGFQLAKNYFLCLAKKTIESKKCFKVALSGGQTPKKLYSLFKKEELDWSKIQFFFSDERAVPADHPDSNYKSAIDGLDHLGIDISQFHRMVAEKDIEKNALQYEKLIKKGFDLICFGMGNDGHTLSLFPNSEGLKEKEHLVTSNDGPNHKRMTLTLKGANLAPNKMFLIFGEDKQTMLNIVLSEKTLAYPASMIENAHFFVDQKAAKLALSNL